MFKKNSEYLELMSFMNLPKAVNQTGDIISVFPNCGSMLKSEYLLGRKKGRCKQDNLSAAKLQKA